MWHDNNSYTALPHLSVNRQLKGGSRKYIKVQSLLVERDILNLEELDSNGYIIERKKISKSEILDFASLTRDKNEVHTNDKYAIEHGFKSSISHGMLTLSFIIGWMYEEGFFSGIMVIFSQLLSVKFIRPVYPNTDLSVKLSVSEKYKSKGGDGTYIIIHVICFETETKVELISFDAKFKVFLENSSLKGNKWLK